MALGLLLVTMPASAERQLVPWWMTDLRGTVAPTAITCPATPIPPRVLVRGTLTRATDCVTTIHTGIGPLNVVGDVYSIFTYGDRPIRVTLDAPEFDDYFGLPYIVMIDPDGNAVTAEVGFGQAVLDFTPTRTARWSFLVTGIGGPFTTPAGEYEVTADYTPVLKRRAVRP